MQSLEDIRISKSNLPTKITVSFVSSSPCKEERTYPFLLPPWNNHSCSGNYKTNLAKNSALKTPIFQRIHIMDLNFIKSTVDFSHFFSVQPFSQSIKPNNISINSLCYARTMYFNNITKWVKLSKRKIWHFETGWACG